MYIGIGILFFGLTWGLAKACEVLGDKKDEVRE